MVASSTRDGASVSSPSPLSSMQSPRNRPCLKALPLNLLKEAPLFSPRTMGSPRPASTSSSEMKTPRTARGSKESSIKVFVRIRPLQDGETRDVNLKWSDNEIRLCQAPSGATAQSYTLGHVLEPGSTQDDMMNMIGRPMVENVMAGYNACCIAYGQTGSGKTFTMLGSPRSLEAPAGSTLNSQLGLAPRVFKEVFQRIAERERAPGRGDCAQLDFTCRCSFLQIYAEKISDLLQGSHTHDSGLALLASTGPGQAVQVKDLSEHLVLNEDDVMDLISRGVRNRHVRETHMNVQSSRSHSVFTMRVECRATDSSCDVAAVRFGTLHFVDLAGSERTKDTGAAGAAMREAQHINQSLSTLRRIIHQVVEAQDARSVRESTGSTGPHIHYRDSKLTFLLQHSLGGNSRTFLVANVSPAVAAAKQTKSTLEFVATAKKVRNVAKVNRSLHGEKEALQAEVAHLKAELSHIKGTLADKGREMQCAVREAAEGVTAATNDMHDLELEASDSKERCAQLLAQRERLQVEASQQCAAASAARDDARRLQEQQESMQRELAAAHATIARLQSSAAQKPSDATSSMNMALEATRAERDKLAQRVRTLEAAALTHGEGSQTRNIPSTATNSSSVMHASHASHTVTEEWLKVYIVPSTGRVGGVGYVEELEEVKNERAVALSELQRSKEETLYAQAQRDKLQWLLDEFRGHTTQTDSSTGRKTVSAAVSRGRGPQTEVLAVQPLSNASLAAVVAGAGRVHADNTEFAPCTAHNSAALSEASVETSMASESGSRTWTVSLDEVLFDQSEALADTTEPSNVQSSTGVGVVAECASFPVAVNSEAGCIEESETDISSPPQPWGSPSAVAPGTPDPVDATHLRTPDSARSPEFSDRITTNPVLVGLSGGTPNPPNPQAECHDVSPSTTGSLGSLSDDIGKENQSAAVRMSAMSAVPLVPKDSAAFDTLATLPEESEEEEITRDAKDAQEGLHGVNSWLSRPSEDSLESAQHFATPLGAGLLHEASMLFDPLPDVLGGSDCGSDSEGDDTAWLQAEPSMLVHLDSGPDGESGSQGASVSVGLSTPSGAGDSDAYVCSGDHAGSGDQGEGAEEAALARAQGELSWAVCGSVCDVSGAEAGLKAMIADMSNPTDGGEAAGKVPGAIQSPVKTKHTHDSDASGDLPPPLGPMHSSMHVTADASSCDSSGYRQPTAHAFDAVGRFKGPQWQAGGACAAPCEPPSPGAVPNSPRVRLQEGQASSLYERCTVPSSDFSPRSPHGALSPRSPRDALSARSPRDTTMHMQNTQSHPLSLVGLSGDSEHSKWTERDSNRCARATNQLNIKAPSVKVPRLALGSVKRVEEDPASISGDRSAKSAAADTSSSLHESFNSFSSLDLGQSTDMGHPQLGLNSVNDIAEHIRYVNDVDEVEASRKDSVDSLPAQVAIETSNEFWDQMISETSRSVELEGDRQGAATTGGAAEQGSSSGARELKAEGGGSRAEVDGAQLDGGVAAGGGSSSEADSPRSAAVVMGCKTPQMATAAAIKKSAITLFGAERLPSGGSLSETESSPTAVPVPEHLTPRSRHIWTSNPSLTPRSRAHLVATSAAKTAAATPAIASPRPQNPQPQTAASSDMDEESTTSSRSASHGSSNGVAVVDAAQEQDGESDESPPPPAAVLSAPELPDCSSACGSGSAQVRQALQAVAHAAEQARRARGGYSGSGGCTTPRTPRGTRIAAAVAATLKAPQSLDPPATPRGSTFRSNSFYTASSAPASQCDSAGAGGSTLLGEGSALRSVDGSSFSADGAELSARSSTPRSAAARPSALRSLPVLSSSSFSNTAAKWRRWSSGESMKSSSAELSPAKAFAKGCGRMLSGASSLRGNSDSGACKQSTSASTTPRTMNTPPTPRTPRGTAINSPGKAGAAGGGGAADRAAVMAALSPRGGDPNPPLTAAVCFGSGAADCKLGCWST